MNNIGNYWITGVNFPERRGELMMWILDLMDKQYQEHKWIYPTESGGQESFDAEISFAIDMIIEELFMDEYVEQNKLPLDKIGDILKNKNEAKTLFEVSKIMDDMLGEYYTNKEYLESPELPFLRKTSLEAFAVFIENEKDNKEFCNFILDVIKKERKWFDINIKEESSYQVILNFIEECKKKLAK